MSVRHALAGVALMLLAGCRPPQDPATVVQFWAMGREGEVVQGLVPDFERRNPGLRVRVQQVPWSAAHEKLLTAFVGNAMPDAFQLGNTWIPEFVALGALEPLDARLQASPRMPVADYFPGIFDTNVIEGTTYAVPWYVDTRLLFYRSDLLAAAGVDAPPRTWEGWIDAMTRVKQHLGADRYAVLLPMTEWQVPVILAMQRNAGLLRDHEQFGDFRAPAFREAFAFYLDLFRRGFAPRAGAAQVANLYQDFAAGYFAFFITGPWNIGEFGRRLPPGLQNQWATAPMPSIDGSGPGVSVAGGASLAINRRSPHRDAAWQWIEYLSEPAQQVRFYELTGDLPARQSAWAAPPLAENRHAQAFGVQLRHVRATPKIPEWERIADLVTRHAEAAIRGRMSLDEALTALDADVDAVLEKRRWMLQRSGGG